MKQIEAAIFDMDGTLLDTLDDLHAAVNAVLADFGCRPATKERVRESLGFGVERLLEMNVPGGSEHPRFGEIVAAYRAYYPSHAEIRTAPYPGIGELLDRLKTRGIGLAVVSNKPDLSTKKLSDRFFPVMDVVIGEQEAAGIRRKPAPDMVLRAMAELGAAPDKAVYIGDSEVDLETARNAGLTCVSVLWGFRDRAFLLDHGASVFARDPAELGRILLGEDS